MYGHDGETVNPRDVLNAEELRDYYANKDRGPQRSFKAPMSRVLRDDLGYFSVDGGRTWGWEPQT